MAALPLKYLPADMPSMLVAVKAWLDSQIAETGTIHAPVDPALLSLLSTPFVNYWGHQDMPATAYPYAVLKVQAPPKSVGGKPWYTTLGDGVLDPFVSRIEYDARFDIRVELRSRAPLDPNSGLDEVANIVCALEGTLMTRGQTELFSNAGLAFITCGNPVYIPSIVGFGFERRAYVDVTFGARVRIDVADPYILDSTSFRTVAEFDTGDGLVHGTVGV